MSDETYQLFLKAKSLIKKRQYNLAIVILRQINRLEPECFIVKFELAKALLHSIHTKEEGKTLLLQLLDTPNKDYAMLELGKLEAREGNIKKAQDYFTELLDSPNKNYALFELGKLEIKQSHTNKARNYFEQLLDTPNSIYAMLELGKLEYSERNIEKARNYFEQILKQQNNTYAMLELGKLEASVRNMKKAREYFTQLLDTPNRNYALLELGKIEASEGNNIQARECFLQLQNTDNEKYANKELIYLDIKEEKYQSAYNRFKDVDPRDCYESDYNHLKVFLEYQLGIIKPEQVTTKDYYLSQLFDYDISKAIDHIQNQLVKKSQKDGLPVFDESVDLEQLIKYAREQIHYLNPIEASTVHSYIIDCEHPVSTIDGQSESQIKVITIPNTDSILVMFPIKTYGKRVVRQRIKEEAN